MAQSCGEHWKGLVCVRHCEECSKKRKLTKHIMQPSHEFFLEHPEIALVYEARLRCPGCGKAIDHPESDSSARFETLN